MGDVAVECSELSGYFILFKMRRRSVNLFFRIQIKPQDHSKMLWDQTPDFQVTGPSLVQPELGCLPLCLIRRCTPDEVGGAV